MQPGEVEEDFRAIQNFLKVNNFIFLKKVEKCLERSYTRVGQQPRAEDQNVKIAAKFALYIQRWFTNQGYAPLSMIHTVQKTT